MNEKLRIVTIGAPTLGGSGIVARRTAAALSERGHDSIFLSYARPPEEDRGVRYIEAQPEPHALFPFALHESALTERLARLLHEERMDAVHVHYATFFGAAALRAIESVPLLERPRFILTCHGTDVVNALSNDLFATLCVRANVVTAVSEDLAQRIRERCPGINPVVISNFIDLELYRPQAKRRRGLQLLHFSNFRPIKQAHLVVECARALGPDATIIFAGDGLEYERTLEHAHAVLGTKRVKAYGVLSQRALAARIAQADVVLLPSRYESFSLAALEAQAAGIPVVGSTEGGMSEVIENGVTGILLDPDAPPSAWAQAVREARVLPDVKVRARARAERFSRERVLSAYESLYRVSISFDRAVYLGSVYMPWCG